MDFSLKTFITIGLPTLMTPIAVRAAEVFHIPDLCPLEQMSLVLSNPSKDPQRAWIQIRKDSDIDELQQELPAQSKLKFSAASFLKTREAFSVKANSTDKVQVFLQCTQHEELQINSITSPEVSHVFINGTQSVKLHLLNLFLGENKIHLKAIDDQGVVFSERTLSIKNSYDTESLKWILTRPALRIDISAEHRIHSEVLYEQDGVERQSPSVSLKPALLPVDSEKAYFLVSTRQTQATAAFVIALDDASTIAKAREQIDQPELEKIVVAQVTLGSGNFNRAMLAKDKSPYSWSVSKIDAFADFAQIDCDGNPDLVEERLEKKLQEGGRICFWRYRVTRELTPIEVATGILLKP